MHRFTVRKGSGASNRGRGGCPHSIVTSVSRGSADDAVSRFSWRANLEQTATQPSCLPRFPGSLSGVATLRRNWGNGYSNVWDGRGTGSTLGGSRPDVGSLRRRVEVNGGPGASNAVHDLPVREQINTCILYIYLNT